MTPTRATRTIAPAGTWVLDPARSTLGFAIRHLMVATVHGHFAGFSGSLRVDGDGDARATGTVHAATLETGNGVRDGRLHGSEFFDADRYPDIRFRSTAIECLDENSWTMTGELTIKHITRPIELRARRLAPADDSLELRLHGQLSRTEFGITSHELLSAGISDTVNLKLHITLLPAPNDWPAVQ
jgi:polyisoprenoid-binding protein YceI